MEKRESLEEADRDWERVERDSNGSLMQERATNNIKKLALAFSFMPGTRRFVMGSGEKQVIPEKVELIKSMSLF